MRLLRRIVVTVVVTLGVIALGAIWVAPVALSFDAARKAPPAARVLPSDLKDLSVSQVPGTKLSYVGYEFEIPWDDLDTSQTEQVPKGNPNPFMVALKFRSGRFLLVSASPPRVFPEGLVREWKIPPKDLESVFGRGAAQSDYSFFKNLYGFSPDKMHLWALFPTVHYREYMLLMLKTTVLSQFSADTGIFNIRNQDYCGFQVGNPQARPRRIAVHLYSDEGSIEFIFGSKDPSSPVAVGQPEINRIVQSLRKVPPSGSPAGS